MEVYINYVDGIADAIIAMYMSKRSWSRKFEDHVRGVVYKYTTREGRLRDTNTEEASEFNDWMKKLCKWGTKHITLLSFIDISCTVEGLHRGGQDDWDAHAKRFNNRIIRSSTRLSDFSDGEMSDFYDGKIIPTDSALAILGIETPEEINVDGIKYIKGVNGYIREEYKNDKDVKRGLYMLSIPSNFIFKIDLREFGHVYKQRNDFSNAHPEVKLCCESIASQLEKMIPWFNRDLLLAIEN